MQGKLADNFLRPLLQHGLDLLISLVSSILYRLYYLHNRSDVPADQRADKVTAHAALCTVQA